MPNHPAAESQGIEVKVPKSRALVGTVTPAEHWEPRELEAVATGEGVNGVKDTRGAALERIGYYTSLEGTSVPI